MKMLKFAAMFLVCFAISTLNHTKTHAEEVITKQEVKQMFRVQHEKGEIVIKFSNYRSLKERQAIYSSFGLTEEAVIKEGLLTLASYPKSKDSVALVQSLINHPDIEFAEPNYKVKAKYVPTDPHYKKQWYIGRINAHHAWNETRGSNKITVAVIDGGLDIYHPDLKGKIYRPYNVVSRGTVVPKDPHGTHVAGTIAATMNRTGTAGIAPHAKIMPINTFKGEYADMFDVAYSIYYAVNNHADIINLSLGSYQYSYTLDQAADYAYENKVSVFAAAGNESTYQKFYPAALPSVTAVSATNFHDEITDFSNVGNYIDIAAPGENIFSSLPYNSFGYMDGTSMATPIVSGTAALMLAKNPFLSPDELTGILFRTAKDLGNKGWDELYGNGRVDVQQAVKQTPLPIFAPAISTKSFLMNGSTPLRASIRVAGKMTGTIYIIDSAGKPVRTLLVDAPPQNGRYTMYWNGTKNDKVTYVPTGQYRIIFRLTDGQQVLSHTMTVDIKNTVKK